MAQELSSELLFIILTRVGGPGNIASCGNCMTRLRLGVHDSSLVDPNIKTLEGVKGVILTSDQVQVVFGPGKAHRAAKAMSELLGEAPVQDAAEIAAQNKRQLKAKQTSGVQQFLAEFAAIFTPPDVVSQLMLAIPLWLLFELGLVLARFVGAGPTRAEADA